VIELLADLDRHSPLIERGEVPASALRADHPESLLQGVESELLADRERLDLIIQAEFRVAVEAGGVDGIGCWVLGTDD
jgi:hypothetical protein